MVLAGHSVECPLGPLHKSPRAMEVVADNQNSLVDPHIISVERTPVLSFLFW